MQISLGMSAESNPATSDYELRGAPRPGSSTPSGPPPEFASEFAQFIDRATRAGRETPLPLKDWRDLAEAWRIALALRSCAGNRSAAARELGIGRRTLYSKMDKLGIEPRW